MLCYSNHWCSKQIIIRTILIWSYYYLVAARDARVMTLLTTPTTNGSGSNNDNIDEKNYSWNVSVVDYGNQITSGTIFNMMLPYNEFKYGNDDALCHPVLSDLEDFALQVYKNKNSNNTNITKLPSYSQEFIESMITLHYADMENSNIGIFLPRRTDLCGLVSQLISVILQLPGPLRDMVTTVIIHEEVSIRDVDCRNPFDDWYILACASIPIDIAVIYLPPIHQDEIMHLITEHIRKYEEENNNSSSTISPHLLDLTNPQWSFLFQIDEIRKDDPTDTTDPPSVNNTVSTDPPSVSNTSCDDDDDDNNNNDNSGVEEGYNNSIITILLNMITQIINFVWSIFLNLLR